MLSHRVDASGCRSPCVCQENGILDGAKVKLIRTFAPLLHLFTKVAPHKLICSSFPPSPNQVTVNKLPSGADQMADTHDSEALKGVSSFSETEVRSSSTKEMAPQGKRTKGQKIKAHFRKWWWLHVILFVVITLLVVLLL